MARNREEHQLYQYIDKLEEKLESAEVAASAEIPWLPARRHG